MQEASSSKSGLLNTIYVPKQLHQLNQNLPKANYTVHTSTRHKNKLSLNGEQTTSTNEETDSQSP